jgi:hypothetical protein
MLERLRMRTACLQLERQQDAVEWKRPLPPLERRIQRLPEPS